MYKVEFWSELSNKYIIKTFETFAEAAEFAYLTHGIILGS